MNKAKFSRFNDGIVYVYREKPRRTDFGAKENVSDLDELSFVVRLDYGDSSIREQDTEFAQQMDFSLSLKVRTRLFRKVDNKCKAIIDGYLYDIKYVDKTREEMWLYLEGVRAIAVK